MNNTLLIVCSMYFPPLLYTMLRRKRFGEFLSFTYSTAPKHTHYLMSMSSTFGPLASGGM